MAAARLGEHVLDTVEKLAAGVFEGPEQELRTGERIRSWPVYPLRLFYVRESDALVVLRVYHSRRKPL